MDKSTLPRKKIVYLLLALLFAVLLIMMPRNGKLSFDYRKGTVWPYETLVSRIDFPLLKTDEQLSEERAAALKDVVPCYRYSEEISAKSLKKMESLDFGGYNALKPLAVSVTGSILDKGIVPDISEADGNIADSKSRVIMIQRDRKTSNFPASDVYDADDAKAKLYSELYRYSQFVSLDSLLKVSGAYDCLTPNLVFDKEATDKFRSDAIEHLSATSGVIPAGTLIVSKGEMVTAEIQQMIDSYVSEYENSLGYRGPAILMWIGNGLIAIALVIILFLSVYYTNPLVFNDLNRYIYLLFIFALTSFAAIFTDRADPNLLYLVPFSLSALYLLAFFSKRVVLPVYVISLLPLLIFAHNGIELFVMNNIAGIVAMYLFNYFNRGWRQFLMSLSVFAAAGLTFIGFRLIEGADGFAYYRNLMLLFAGSLLSVAGYPLIYLFEKVFGLVSSSKLVELCDTNMPLLQLLAKKAPGTFQHSLQVMNMADAVARSVDADVELIRAGALYHDIGKSSNPLCFIENETSGRRYHEGLTPQESAKSIIRHVADGMALAGKYNLPSVVSDFIRTHHGTTVTGYFYGKYLEAGGSPENIGEFRYDGVKPFTKEQTILMICDTVEAASRTLKDSTTVAYDELVEKLTAAKMADGQFEDSEISIKELNVIKAALKSYLAQLYHARVVYPKQKQESGVV